MIDKGWWQKTFTLREGSHKAGRIAAFPIYMHKIYSTTNIAATLFLKYGV